MAETLLELPLAFPQRLAAFPAGGHGLGGPLIRARTLFFLHRLPPD
jgi:hypothetical protein